MSEDDSIALSSRQSPRVRERETSLGPAPSNTLSPSLKPKAGAKLKRFKSKPHLKRSSSAGANYKLVFSVDDDVDDDIIEEDAANVGGGSGAHLSKTDKEYLEGYNDALRSLYQRRGRSRLTDDSEDGSRAASSSRHNRFKAVPVDSEHLPGASSSINVESQIIKNLLGAEERLENLEREGKVADSNNSDEERPPTIVETDEEGTEGSGRIQFNNNVGADDQSPGSNSDSASLLSSTSSLESLNLRERQDAINSTHPFGIKIWKPSLYKKKRSVATRAEEDIHDYDLREPTYRIFWGVYLCNIIWSCTFGLGLYLVCVFGCLLVFVFSGFGLHRSSRRYVQLLFSVAKYWLFPFGKFVLLNKDKNYMDEDQLDGRSLVEFQRWREQEEGRLFFAPPRRYTTNSESRPLLKDHKGRPLSDAYSSLGDQTDPNVSSATIEDDADEEPFEISDIKKRFFGRGSWSSGRLMFYLYFYIVIQPILFVISFFCWLFVFTIPMAKIMSIICDHLRRHPLALHFELEKEYYDSQGNESESLQNKRKHQSIIMCTYRCCGFHYYKYTIDGTNIFFINLLSVVVFVILDYYLLKENFGFESWYTEPTFIFCACLFSVIPLAYFIGQAVASISAQSSMGVGAVINAFFSTIVEIFLYCVALNQSKGKLVEGSLIGSILGGVLLLPGLSMCGGALKRKTQRYNPRSAGVSSTMLLFAMVMMFAPSMFYQIYGTYEIICTKCSATMMGSPIEDDCTKCRFIQSSFTLDALYHTVIRPFSLIVALALFLAYTTGLYFTLRTHASLIWATNSHEQTAATKREENVARTPSVISLETPKKSTVVQPDGKTKVRSALSSPTIEIGKQRFPLVQKPSSGNMPTTKPKTPNQEPSKRNSLKDIQENSTQLQEEDETTGGHDAPNWSRKKSTVILLGATLLYAIIAEILVDNVDSVLSDFPINPKFLGLTVFALVPNTTEFLNAISFAVGGNVALSMEIGSAYALQVVLIQIPSLVVYSIYKNFKDVDMLFTLVFPRWDIIATLMSIFLFTYIYAEGKSNYFKGVILILIYFVALIGFWFNDKIEDLDGASVNSRFAAMGSIY
ncbi:low affinity vacuolar monovalent cation/H(+) antiporter [[Candida] anglica]|uniref:Low affinity vacuolar monovalent cation/H(+) antiporter n=1 Tax=[Candida] anglica TaxID=148631 RepID=A0ABP0EK14_9ASCO